MTIFIIIILLIALILIIHSRRTFENVKKYDLASVFLADILNNIKSNSDNYEILITNKGRVKIQFSKMDVISTLDFIYNPKSLQITLRSDFPFKNVEVKNLNYNIKEINNYLVNLGII
jgi:hypothetical protein